jgi:hypothetical protein
MERRRSPEGRIEEEGRRKIQKKKVGKVCSRGRERVGKLEDIGEEDMRRRGEKTKPSNFKE